MRAAAPRWPFNPEVLASLGAAALAALIGLLCAAGYPAIGVGLIAALVAFGVGLANWRWSMIGLLAYMPVSGVLTLALYPTTAPGVLAKDFAFVLPAYAGFFGTYLAERRPILFDGAPLVLMSMLGALVIFNIFNPALPALLVGLVGAKVWLLYMPLLFIGYALIRTRDDLRFVLALMSITAILPAVIGVIEAVLIYSGHSNTVYGWYGAAAQAATQGFATIQIGQSQLLRVPSTFSFVAQYYVFTACMSVVAYAWLRIGGRGPGTPFRACVLALMLLAAFTSGSRGAFVFIPLLFAVIFLIEGRLEGRTIGIMLAGAAGILFTISLVGFGLGQLISALAHNASFQWTAVFVDGFKQVGQHLLAGLGTGADTNAARYVLPNQTLQFSATGAWQESWWVKTGLELGVAGTILSLLLFSSMAFRGLQRHRLLRDPRLRSVSAGFIALIIWTMAYGVKAQYLDLDPLNVYLWLFSGMMFKLYVLPPDEDDEGGETEAAEAEASAASNASRWRSATGARA